MVTATELRRIAAARGIDMPIHDGAAVRVETTRIHEALKLVENLDLVVLGLDGLKQDGAMVLPLDDYIADLGSITGSWEERVTASAAAAEEIATGWGRIPTFVELTLDGLDSGR